MLKINSIATTFGAIAILSSLLGSCIPEVKTENKTPVAAIPSASPKNTEAKTEAKSVATTKPESSAKSDARILKVKIDGLETYKHSSGLFQIDVPKRVFEKFLAG